MRLAAKPGVVNMGQGAPDFVGSSIALRAAAAAAEAGGAADNQYSAKEGTIKLRVSVADFMERRYGHRPDPTSEVVITAGGQEALACMFLAFCNPGDEVITFEPYFPFMLGAMQLAGATPRCVTLEAPNFTFDEATLRAAASSTRAKMLIVNTPHNPTGRVATAAELEMIGRVCREYGLIAVSDEVYEHCVFHGLQHRRLADVDGMRDRTITIGSGGKLFSLTGWRVAWAVGPRALVGPLTQVHTQTTFCSPTPLQLGVAAALDCDAGLADISDLFEENAAMLTKALHEGTTLDVFPPDGGYFLIAQTPDGEADIDYCRRLAETKGVAATPMSVFYATDHWSPARPCNLVRFTVCKSREHVQRACDALRHGPRL